MKDLKTFIDPRFKTLGERTVNRAKEILSKLNIPFWLSNGSLLGCIREGNLIPHDEDIDIGVWDACCLEHEVIKRSFLENGFRLCSELGRPGNAHEYSFITPEGVRLDIFFYIQEADHCWMGLWTSAEKPMRMVFPSIPSFIMKKFAGGIFPVPSNYEDMLYANYGDWQVPDKTGTGLALQRIYFPKSLG